MTASFLEVRLAELTELPGPELEAGGQSRSVTFRRAPCGSSYLFKRYQSVDVQPDALPLLRALARWRLRLPPDERAWLDARASWVRHVVVDDQRAVLGVLLAVAPVEFWRSQRDGSVVPRPMGALARAERSSDYEYFNLPHSLARLGHALETLTFLHERGLVYGDLHRGNILVSGLPEPRSYLIDTDALILDGRSPLAAVEVEKYRGDHLAGWPESLDASTDLYKFAMCSVGVLAENAAATGVTAQVTRVLQPQHGETLDGMLSLADLGSAQLRLMARSWQSAVTPQGEFSFSSDSISKTRWQGSASRDRPPTEPLPRTDGCSPGPDRPVAPAAAPTPAAPAQASPDTPVPASPTPPGRTRPSPRLSRTGWLVAVVAGLALIVLVLALLLG